MAVEEKASPSVVTQPSVAEPESVSLIETPTSPSSGVALSRFEFETGSGNEGTKILMVEWERTTIPGSETDDERDYHDWKVTWEGKTEVLMVRDKDVEDSSLKRVFYLLPPGAQIPTLINISHCSGGRVLRTKPMPAIFPERLGINKDAGKRGVLHTTWAKKRVAELEDEIEAEMKANGESVGLQMALQERDWIVDHFGLEGKAGSTRTVYPLSPQSPTSPTSPKSPVGGRLGDKLRGLKLATSPTELAAATQGTNSKPTRNTSHR